MTELNLPNLIFLKLSKSGSTSLVIPFSQLLSSDLKLFSDGIMDGDRTELIIKGNTNATADKTVSSIYPGGGSIDPSPSANPALVAKGGADPPANIKVGEDNDS